MKLFILAQYFTETMVLTITIGLSTLKPVEQGVKNTVQVTNVMLNDQEMLKNELYK